VNELTSKEDSAGVVFLVSSLSSSKVGLLVAMNEAKVHVHSLGSSNLASTLRNKEDWPRYQRVVSSDEFKMPILAELFVMNGWDSF
jgi:hypothetical protein